MLSMAPMRLPHNIGRYAPFGWVALSILVLSCQKAPWLTMAQRGTLPELSHAIAQGQQHNAFTRARVEELAVAVAQREIRSATDPEGEHILAQLSDCALRLEAPLLLRAERTDETAGTALQALVAAGWQFPNEDWASAIASARGALRAAAALDSQAKERWAIRQTLLNDADPRVRLAALKSCLKAPALQHWDTLVALLRRDPEPQCRQDAAISIGILGGDEATSVLMDAWARADAPLRMAIVSALSQARTFSIGGQRRLIAIARSEPGLVGVLAAANLATGTSVARSFGSARLTRSLEFGASEDKALAISVADWRLPEHAEQLLRLGLTAEPEIRVHALGRWLAQPDHQFPAITWLRQLALGDSSAALLARELLALQGDQTVRLALRAQLGHAKWASRAHAARLLWKLGDVSGVAQALADDAPEVRVATACGVLLPGNSP